MSGDGQETTEERLGRLEATVAYAVELLNRILAKAHQHLEECPECESGGDALTHLAAQRVAS